MIEEWRPVVGWEGLYEVSSQGRVRSLPRSQKVPNGGAWIRPGKIRKPDFKNNRDHGRLWLVHKTRKEHVWVHRLVARAFVGEPPEDKPMVLHWDDNPHNNTVGNLRYGDAQDNKDDAVRNGKAKRDTPRCPRGHEYVDENLVGASNGSKRCRTCEYGADRIKHFERLKAGIPIDDKRHGTYAGYRAGCRCEGCFLANRDYKREYGRLWRTRKRLLA